MNNKIKSIVSTLLFAIVVLSFSATCWLKPAAQISESERRELAQFPELSLQTVFNGKFMSNFESYAADQFPARDSFRTIKALFNYNLLHKLDNNGLIFADGHLSKLEYPVNEHWVENSAAKFNALYEKYIKDKGGKVYLSLVPDKNYFLGKQNGYLTIDYEKFSSDFSSKLPYMKYIDIMPLLSLEDYYKTDSHWKQENIAHIAEFIAEEMGTSAKGEYETIKTGLPFNGVYSGQAALPVKPDTLNYLTNETLENMVVTYYNDMGKKKSGDMYDMEKATGKDPYEMFLSGTQSVVEIENPAALTDKELIIFRDSFGSSISPILAQGYKKVTVVDIRYVAVDFVGQFVPSFENKDVLFLYSTTLINNSGAMK